MKAGIEELTPNKSEVHNPTIQPIERKLKTVEDKN